MRTARVLLGALALVSAGCGGGGSSAGPSSTTDPRLASACAAVLEPRDAVLALQEAPEVTAAGNARLHAGLQRLAAEAAEEDQAGLGKLANEALEAEKKSSDEALPLPVRHEAFHVVVSRVGQAMVACRRAGQTMAGPVPTVPGAGH